jgi:hypothetical protein
MSADLSVIRGDSVTLTATLVDSLGAAYDLTGADLTFTVDGLFEKSLGAGITVADPLDGVAEIAVDPDDTDGAPNTRYAYRYDLQVTLADASVKTPLRGLFIVVPDVTT